MRAARLGRRARNLCCCGPGVLPRAHLAFLPVLRVEAGLRVRSPSPLDCTVPSRSRQSAQRPPIIQLPSTQLLPSIRVLSIRALSTPHQPTACRFKTRQSRRQKSVQRFRLPPSFRRKSPCHLHRSVRTGLKLSQAHPPVIRWTRSVWWTAGTLLRALCRDPCVASKRARRRRR